MPFSSIPDAIEDIRAGRMVVVVDDEDRENEGDLTVAAEKVTPDVINFMARHGRGLICLPMTGERLDELRIPLMVTDEENSARFGTAFCVPIEAKVGTTTGISAADRARTVLAAIDPKTRPADLARPGHMFPLRAMPGGVLVRAGQTEAAVDLARLAGLYPAGVICEVMAEDGTMMRAPRLQQLCRQHGLRMGKIMAYHLQDQGQDTVEANETLGFKADQRDYGIGAQILAELGVHKMRLLTNNPRKFVGLEGYGLQIVERLPIEIPASDASRRYLKTKKEKLGHLLRGI